MSIEAKVILDSVSPAGKRLTTMELTYPRFIHCFDYKTEILCMTRKGPKFLSFEEAQKRDFPVASYSREHDKIFWNKPVSWLNENYNGDMIILDEQQISFCVTPNHRLYVKNRTQKGWNKDSIIYAKDWFNNQINVKFKKSSFCDSYTDTWLSINELKLLGFFIGDGTISGNQAIFHLKKKRKIDYVCDILDSLDVEWTIINYSDGSVNVKTNHLIDIFRNCYNKKEKIIPYHIAQCSTDCIDALFDGLKNSDGSIKGDTWEYNTTSKELANQIQEIGCINGKVFNLRSYKDKDGILFKFRECKQLEPLIRKDRHRAKKIKYSGKIYCCTVSTGLIIVRRNGIVHISGNSEFMTHRMFSRNAASSRAIPTRRMIQMVEKDPAMPIYWGQNKRGMAAAEEITESARISAEALWLLARDAMVACAKSFREMGLHKQIANRILEPWKHITVICTATEWSNFFALRRHEDAQPEIHRLGDVMFKAQEKSQPKQLSGHSWHMPYIDGTDKEAALTMSPQSVAGAYDILRQASVARCARVSYLTHDGKRDLKKDLLLHERLLTGSGHGHWSPFEHVAMPLQDPAERSGNFIGWKQYRKMFKGECQ